MKETPIIFDAESINAILAGKKTMTRRVITVPWHKGKRCQPYEPYYEIRDGVLWFADEYGDRVQWPCPYGKPGDILWVKETWRCEELEDGLDGVRYRADHAFVPIENSQDSADLWCEARGNGDGPVYGWKSPLYMPRWASRISLEVVSRRAERLQAITEGDAFREGVERIELSPSALNGNPVHPMTGTYIDAFKARWDALNAKRGFPCADNPGVWVVEFKLREVKK